MLLVALDVASAPVVIITHSSCFAVTFLTIPCRPIMTNIWSPTRKSSRRTTDPGTPQGLNPTPYYRDACVQDDSMSQTSRVYS